MVITTEREVFKVLRPDKHMNKRPVDLVRLKVRGETILENIVKYINQTSKDLYNKGFRGKFNTTINDAPIHAFTSSLLDIGQEINLKEKNYIVNYFWHSWGVGMEEEELKEANLNLFKYFNNPNSKSSSFNVHIYPTTEEGGCDGKYNDCMYDALESILGTKLTKKYPTKQGFKQGLKLKPKDQVHKDLIPLIEQKLNVNIEVEGDVMYASPYHHDITVPLILTTNHWTANKEKLNNKGLATNTSFKECKVVFRAHDKDSNTFMCYDGETHFNLSVHDMKQELCKPMSSKSKCIFIKERMLKKDTHQDKLENKHREFTDQADKLKKITNGRINMYKTGKVKDTALQLFSSTIKHIEPADNISQDETEWILGCYNGGLIFGDEYEGPAYYADINSSYPSILRSLIEFPYKRGQFLILDGLPHIIKFGIYRANITPVYTEQVYKYFHINQKNKYTHIEINYAIKQGLKVELIQDGLANFLHYPDDCRLKGSQLFREYIDFVYDIKKKHKDVHFAKRLLNILGGALAERNNKEYIISQNSEALRLANDEEIINVKSMNDDEIKVETCVISNQFKTGFARVYPFLTAKGRCKIADEILKVGPEHVKRCHTDSLLSSVPIPHIKDKTKVKIGEIGFEGSYKHIKVVNCMEVVVIDK